MNSNLTTFGNAIFYLSCYATFMEAYIGIHPTRETFAHFFSLRINSFQGKEIPKPKPPVECGSCIVGSRQGSPFFKFTGLESCRAWQGTFFYVKNNGRANLIDLPPFKVGPPSRANWSYNPKTDHIETNRVIRFMASLKKETNICSDDIIRTFISRRVLPLKRRMHRMSEMYGPRDPTKITAVPLARRTSFARLAICLLCHLTGNGASFTSALLTLRPKKPRTASPSSGAARPLPEAPDSVDPDPYIFWKDRRWARPRLAPWQIHEHVPPLRAEAGSEFVDKLMARGQKKATASDAGSSQALPPSASAPSLGGEGSGHASLQAQADANRLRPCTQAWLRRALKVLQGPQPLLLAQAKHHLGAVTLSSPSGAQQDTGASNIGAEEEEVAGRAEPSAPPVLEKTTTSAPSLPRRKVPTVTRLALPFSTNHSHATARCPRTKLRGRFDCAAAQDLQAYQGEGDGLQRSFGGQQPLVLHVSKAARDTATRPPACLAVSLRQVAETDPVGDRSSEEHFMRLRSAVKELDSAWYDATNNLMLTADARKALFEELLWEHRELAEAHDKCQVIPEASIDALKEQLAAAQREKDQLIRQHQEELSAHKTSYHELKSQLVQLGLDHAKALKAAEADAAAKMDEALEDAAMPPWYCELSWRSWPKPGRVPRRKLRGWRGAEGVQPAPAANDTLAYRKSFLHF
ncbi:hypothetical protein QYE76_060962 [Lolium multiflorum]|uniref:Uncharacterized protein n=1 Tax=Lolium multiflorum TaxID=4521 RepID=A0AAD8W724_LOLMU|nr:hypothetical protein QYE76_060962 [Lolium multiflorum]